MYQSIKISDLFEEVMPGVNEYLISKDKFAFIVFDTQQALYSNYSNKEYDEHLKILNVNVENIENLLESSRRNDELKYNPIVSITEDDEFIKLVVKMENMRAFELKDNCYQYFENGTIKGCNSKDYFDILIEYINNKLVYYELAYKEIDIWDNFVDCEIDYIPIEFKDGKFSFQFGRMKVGGEKVLSLVDEEWIVEHCDIFN